MIFFLCLQDRKSSQCRRDREVYLEEEYWAEASRWCVRGRRLTKKNVPLTKRQVKKIQWVGNLVGVEGKVSTIGRYTSCCVAEHELQVLLPLTK